MSNDNEVHWRQVETALKNVLAYNWYDEIIDFLETYEETGGAPKHIFRELAVLDQFLYGHSKTPEVLAKESLPEQTRGILDARCP